MENKIIPPLIQLVADSNAEETFARTPFEPLSTPPPMETSGRSSFGSCTVAYFFCADMLTESGPTFLVDAWKGLEKIFKVGEDEARVTGGRNTMAVYVSEAEGLAKYEGVAAARPLPS